MINDIINWLIKIEEDYPLPFEIKYLYFILHKENDISFISFCGNELNNNLSDFDYEPLDGEFFLLHDNNFHLLNLRLLLINIIKNKDIKKIYSNKYIFYMSNTDNIPYEII